MAGGVVFHGAAVCGACVAVCGPVVRGNLHQLCSLGLRSLVSGSLVPLVSSLLNRNVWRLAPVWPLHALLCAHVRGVVYECECESIMHIILLCGDH